MILFRNYVLNIFLVLVISITISGKALAQNACFTVSATQVCVNEVITFTNCSTAPGGVLHDITSGTPVVVGALSNGAGAGSTTATRSTPGVYQFRQTVTNSTTQIIAVTVVGTPTPTFTYQNCSGNVVNVLTDNLYDNYQIDWGDGSGITTAPASSTATHTYGVSGSYTVSIVGTYSVASCTGPVVTHVFNTIASIVKPDIIALRVNTQASPNGNLDLYLNLNASQQYVLQQQQGGGGYTDIATLSYPSGTPPQQFTYTTLSTSLDPYYYRLYAFDDCGNPPVYSDDIYSSVVTVTPQNNQNLIEWVNHSNVLATNFDHYDIYKDGSILASGITTNTATNSYVDPGLQCGEVHTYQVVTYTSTGQVAYSAIISATAISTTTPTSVTNVNSTVNSDGQVHLRWTNAVGFVTNSIHIERSDNGGTFVNRGNSSVNQYTDGGANTSSDQHCYQINYHDVCNNLSTNSALTCPVLLQVSSTTELNTLTWTSYTGYTATGIQSYEVEILDDNNNVIRTINAGLTFTTTDAADANATTMRYRIRVIANGTENLTSYSNIVVVSFEPQIHVPNAFTPNADGNNDIFAVKGQFYQNLQMTIFNQWGEVIFSSTDAAPGWDGAYNGEPAPVDDYAYIIKAQDNKGGEIVRKGTVSLLR